MPYADAHRQAGCPCERCERARAYQRMHRAGQRLTPEPVRPVQPKPRPVRTYGTSRNGFDYDAAIQAAAHYSVPPSGLPRNGGDAR